jgi:phage-related protein|tara:strand:+ start:4145 stop:4522 length:378 start_codon:yes stop_codon:yes gene_type:complete
MAIGFNVGGSLGTVVPDKGLTLANKPKVLTSTFGDGYEHRIADGINNTPQSFSLSFATRPKAEIDDIVDFFETKGAVTPFSYIVSDSNSGSNERTVKVICETWSQTWAYDNFYSLTAKFRRVYES